MLLEKISLEPDEEVLKIVRKHWFVITMQIVSIFLTAIIPIILLTAFIQIPKSVGLFDPHAERYGMIFTFVIATWLLLCTLSAFVVWTQYYLDLWMITDRRIIAIDHISFFNRNVAIFRLERLQDIEFTINGLIQTFFNFGTLSAQTAGHMEANFTSDGLPDPAGLQATIQQAMDARLSELNNKPNLSGE